MNDNLLLTLKALDTALELQATLAEKARLEGATPEQLAERRAKAIERFDRAAAAVAASEPPPIIE